MIDRLFSLALLLCVLAGGTAAIGAELFARAEPAPTVVQLPRVLVTGRATPTIDAARLARDDSPDAPQAR
ncbi:hypothetical protein [Piscinibacter sakaiensis]|uniref:Uncharacterized protein n=1 Tax=Piscinibacter sakaiensis TaxID=1547922 RepID=A0A0K8P4V6_PISS1|nr:hypothetical protein [Piscinibacter sakaiensis]GAP37698.1 hypothetical protein ISF6_3643 [Piscinibacter sakaiensis]